MKRQYWMVCLMSLALVATVLHAQDEEQPDRPERRGRGGEARQIDPEQRRQWMERAREQFSQRIKEQLGATDEEWTVIRPRLEKLAALRGQGARAPMVRIGGPRGGDDQQRPQPQREQTEIEKKTLALRQAVETNADAAKIKQAMTELREARKKHEAQVKTAADELREVLTLKQEAMLVSYGMLD